MSQASNRKKLLKKTKKQLITECKRLRIKYFKTESKGDLITKLLAKYGEKGNRKVAVKKRDRWFKEVSKYGCQLKHEYLIHGYLYNVDKLRQCPMELIVLMLMYLGKILELKFNITQKKNLHTLKDNGTLIENRYQSTCLYGCSKVFNSGTHEWHIKCKTKSKDFIGIISKLKICKSKSTIFRRICDLKSGKDNKCYFYYIDNDSRRIEYVQDGISSIVKSKFVGWKKNDVVTVKLDCISWTIEFRVNNEKLHSPIDIIRHKKYYAILSASNRSEYKLVY